MSGEPRRPAPRPLFDHRSLAHAEWSMPSSPDPFGWSFPPIDLPPELSARDGLPLLKATLSAAPFPVVITLPDVGPDGPTVTYVNPAFTASTGYLPADIVGKSVWLLRGPNSSADVQGRLARRLAGGATFDAEDVNYRKDGSEYLSRWSVVPIRHTSGQVLRYLSYQRHTDRSTRPGDDILRRVTAAVPGAVYRYTVGADGSHRYQYLSAGAGDLFGVSVADALADPDVLFARIHRDDQESSSAARSKTVSLVAQSRQTFRVVLPSGQTRWVHDQSSPEPTAPDGSITWNGTYTDVTPLKLAKERLRVRLEQLQSVGDNLPDGVVYRMEVAPGGAVRFPFLSAGLGRLTGLTARDLVGDPGRLEAAIHPDDREQYRAAVAGSLAGGRRFALECRLRTRQAGDRWVLWRGTPHRRPDGQGVLDGLILDITARKQSEDTAAQAHGLLRTVIDAFPGLISVKDPGYRYVVMNRYQADLYGTTPDGAVGRTAGDLISAEYGERTAGRDQQVMDQYAPLTYEETAPDAAGRPHTWLTTKTPWVAGPDVAGVITVSTDLAPLKQAEDRLREAARYESVALLAGGVAHDFNNLMTAVLCHAELAAEYAGDGSPVHDHLGPIALAARRAADLCRRLMAFAGQSQAPVQPIDLPAVVREMVALLRTVIPKQVDVALDLPDGLPAIEGDPTQLRQVVMNLVTNAADAMGDRAGVIRLRAGTRSVDPDWLRAAHLADTATAGEYVELAVTDGGCGIPADVLGRMFDPYVSTKAAGRGLGLAAVRGIVRAARGALRVDTRVGFGTTFTLVFPVSSRPPAPLSGAVRVPSRRPLGTVLVVREAGGVGSVIDATLRAAGYEVVAAATLAEAAAAEHGHGAALVAVILDLARPEQNARQAVRELTHAHLPAVLVGGHMSERLDAILAEFPHVRFLLKPFHPRDLVAAVRDAVAG